MKLAASPVEAKAHGAWLGAGTGVGLAQAVVAVVQAILGHPLASGYVTGIYVLGAPLLAFIGAYLAPHTPRSANPTINQMAEAAETLGLELHPVAVPLTPPPQVQPPAPATGPAS